ncbi:MAG: hypothetical protein LBT08_07585 [Synergistaceae bacterium]|jgi:membrane protein implicated in regulation of membrane protease activity|nr:hypothetical protein [Synergistaceae bacterium]
MVKSLVNVILGFFDLLEAEGRALRNNAAHLCFIVVFFIIAGVLTVSGCILLFGGVFHIVANALGRVQAFFATGLACLIFSVVLFTAGFWEMSRKRRRGEEARFREQKASEGEIHRGSEGEPEALHGDGKSNPPD